MSQVRDTLGSAKHQHRLPTGSDRTDGVAGTYRSGSEAGRKSGRQERPQQAAGHSCPDSAPKAPEVVEGAGPGGATDFFDFRVLCGRSRCC